MSQPFSIESVAEKLEERDAPQTDGIIAQLKFIRSFIAAHTLTANYYFAGTSINWQATATIGTGNVFIDIVFTPKEYSYNFNDYVNANVYKSQSTEYEILHRKRLEKPIQNQLIEDLEKVLLDIETFEAVR